jgi:DNA-binding response OmpR family regulator
MGKILIIEDDRNLSELLSLRLKSVGYEADAAYDGKEGWKKVREEKPDLVILDILLPLVDGIVLCGLIKNDKALKKIPVIMLTSKKTVGDWDEGLNAGADIYIGKPYDWDDLISKIKSFIPVPH